VAELAQSALAGSRGGMIKRRPWQSRMRRTPSRRARGTRPAGRRLGLRCARSSHRSRRPPAARGAAVEPPRLRQQRRWEGAGSSPVAQHGSPPSTSRAGLTRVLRAASQSEAKSTGSCSPNQSRPCARSHVARPRLRKWPRVHGRGGRRLRDAGANVLQRTRSLAGLATKKRRPLPLGRPSLNRPRWSTRSLYGQGTGATNETGLFGCRNASWFGVPK